MTETNIYKIMTIRFRKEEDAELLEELEKAVAEGRSKREVLRNLYYYKPELPEDLCSIKDVEQLMMTYRIPRLTRINIIVGYKQNTQG